MFNIDLDLIFFRIKLLSAILSFLFSGFAVYFIVEFKRLVSTKTQMAKLALRIPEAAFKGASQSRWEEILRHVDSAKEAEWKFAVVEADKLVDDLLKKAGYFGESMGERLSSIERGQLANLDHLWEAHKIRNKLVHDVNYFIRQAEARQAVKFYEEALRELQGI